jgi:hypothetical protein
VKDWFAAQRAINDADMRLRRFAYWSTPWKQVVAGRRTWLTLLPVTLVESVQ